MPISFGRIWPAVLTLIFVVVCGAVFAAPSVAPRPPSVAEPVKALVPSPVAASPSPSASPTLKITPTPNVTPRPTPSEVPQYWPYHSLERAATSSRDLSLPSRNLIVLPLRDRASFDRFWTSAHYFRDTFQADTASPPPPPVDFGRFMAVAVIGRAGSADIHVQKMWTLPGEVLVLGVFNPFWPDIPMNPERVPYEIVIARRSERRTLAFERPNALSLIAITRQALAPLRLPDIESVVSAAGSDSVVTNIRQALAARGQQVLTALSVLKDVSPSEACAPYARMLQASILGRMLGQTEEARRTWREVLLFWPGTRFAHIAKSRLAALDRRAMDDVSRHDLDAARAELASRKSVEEDHARRWLELGSQYEYLTSQELESLYLAACCYLEAARDPKDDDRAQNALLRAASLYELYFDPAVALRLYWQCVERFPDAQSVPNVLQRMALIGWELRQRNADVAVYSRFLKQFPTSHYAPAVKTWLRRIEPTVRRPVRN